MSKRWLTGLLASCLTVHAPARADNPLDALAAIIPQTKPPPDRPTELPGIDPRLDISPLVKPNDNTPPQRPPSKRRYGPDYDPSLLYLPDRNPGLRQPPCPCLPRGRWWLNTAYFLGTTLNDKAPPLVAGAGGATLYGGEHIDHPFRSGFRLEAGTWLDHCQNWGIDSSFFIMQATQQKFAATSAGDATLARPFISHPSGQAGIDLLAGPGIGRGAIAINSPLTFLGADVNLRTNLLCEDVYRVDFLAGYRFIRMSEELNISSQRFSTTGVTTEVQDFFRAISLFHGGQIGLAGEIRFERFYLSGVGKVAFGATWSQLDIAGQTRTVSPAGATTTANGLLARGGNLGSFHNCDYAVVPEATFMAGYQLFDHWRAYVGYTFVYANSVARAGQAIDLNVGTSTAGVVFPQRVNANSDFWMHGINLGLEARY